MTTTTKQAQPGDQKALKIMTGDDMKSARQVMGLTQSEMALLIGMRQAHYCRLENGAEGRRPTGSQLAAVSAIIRLHELGALPLYLATKKNTAVQK